MYTSNVCTHMALHNYATLIVSNVSNKSHDNCKQQTEVRQYWATQYYNLT